MDLQRILKHIFYPPWLLRRALPKESLKRIEAAIADSETRHSAEIVFAVEPAIHHLSALLKGKSARDRAIEVFSLLRCWDTEHNNGILIYLLLADKRVEIIADRGINALVPQPEWEGICRLMERDFSAGRLEQGIINGINEIERHLVRHFPAGAVNPDELPDRPHVL
ncbi:MAG: TPM domain-containing protein [Dissulfurimicrobium sp.]|uniref:TPM domain-containing protein n=1 Tax=Dissulfurimicrobium sp. TaxID=2022436 RepID=UPI004049A879